MNISKDFEMQSRTKVLKRDFILFLVLEQRSLNEKNLSLSSGFGTEFLKRTLDCLTQAKTINEIKS